MCNSIVITNRSLVSGDFLQQIGRVLELEPYALILRERDLNDAEYTALARQVMALCAGHRTILFLHARTAVAEALECRNIHLPLPVLTARDAEALDQLRERFDRISVSCHSLADVRLAASHGATQIVLGTIYETDCKKGVKGKGISYVREACLASPVPVYAIGGLTPARIDEVMAAGAAGGCMMSWFMRYGESGT